jgi:hypothetical protein
MWFRLLFKGRLANIPLLTLAAVTLAICSVLICPGIVRAEAGLEGVTGLLNIPTAEVLKDGEITVGFGRNDNKVRFPGSRQRNYFAGIGFLPRLELTARYIDFPEIQDTGIPGFGTRKDRSVNAKFQLLSEDKNPLSLAVGVYDLGGQAVHERGAYGVASKTFGKAQFTLGYGDKRLDGFFGGVSIKPVEKLDLMYEYDSYDHNFGVRFSPHPDWHLTAGSVAGDFTFGLSYTKQLPSSRNPKPIREGVTLSRLPVESDTAIDELSKELVRQGLQNVRVGWNAGVLDVQYENRRFRTEEEAWAFVCDWAASRSPEGTQLVRVHSLREQSPIVSTSFKPDELISFANGEIGEKEFTAKLAVIDESNTDGITWGGMNADSSGATDIFFQPVCTLDLGRAYTPVRQRSGIAVEQKTSLGSGFSLASRMEIPLSNSLDGRDSPFFVRGYLAHSRPWGGGWYTTSEVGYFDYHRWGGQLDLRKFWFDSRFDIGVTAGLLDNNYSHTTDDQFLASGSVRIPSLDLTLTGTNGKFIWGDEGSRLQAGRRFGAYTVEFFYFNTTYTNNEAGVRVNIPLLGFKGGSSRVRLDFSPVFPYEYRTSQAHRAETLHYSGSVYEYRSWLYPWHLRENVYLLREAAGFVLAAHS